VPFAIDSSLALRPDLGARSRDVEGATTPDEQRAFAGELERAQRAPQATEANQPAAATLVAARRTRLSGSEAAEALRAAWTQVRGEAPSQETLSVLVGQWAHETGRGQSMLNYNFGGIKGTGPSGLSAAYSTREGWGEGATREVARFRAYGSAEEGARDYVSLLARRYPNAVSAAEAGDARGFVQALKTKGYFTDNVASYSRSVESLAARARSAGFDAIGSVPGRDAGSAASEAGLADALLASAAQMASAEPSRLTADVPLAGGALLDTPAELTHDPRAGLSVAPSAFADEVNRAALLMSALRIAEPGSRRG
jgi:flagellum-specific peptidoglycan hydrolase FlgJ